MENKYYTPNISEFYVGFEFEIKTPKLLQFVETIYSEDDFNEGKFREGAEFRVKYLDENDLISLGFKMTENNKKLLVLDYERPLKDHREHHCKTYIHYNLISKWMLISSGNRKYTHEDENKYDKAITRFCGYILNKSELKKILLQLDLKVAL